MIKKGDIKKYYNSQASIKVLSNICKNPKLLDRGEYKLDKEDFVGKTHQLLFTVCYNLNNQGANKINLSDIEAYLSLADNSTAYNLFFGEKNQENLEWLNYVLSEDCDNYDYYYSVVKKFGLLREYLYNGVDITDIYDVNQVDIVLVEKQKERFDNLTITDMINLVDKRVYNVKSLFTINNSEDARKSGDEVDELIQRLQEAPLVGWNTESQYLTSIISGVKKGEFYFEARDSATGKTRMGLKRAIMYCATELWDFKEKKFIKNPCNKDGNNSALFINTEMKLLDEIEPIILAELSGIPSGRIKRKIKELDKDEQERLNHAIQLSKDMKLYLEKESDYDIAYLRDRVSYHKREHNIGMVVLDYIEDTPSLMVEYKSLMKGANVSSHQMLSNLSKVLKDIAVEFDVAMFAMSQVNGEARSMGVRDANAIAGSKAIQNKCDYGMTVFRPTQAELKKIEPLCKFGTPDTCISIFKARDSDYGQVKIWLKVNLGNGSVQDLFVTNWAYEKLKVPKTWVEF